MDPRTPLPVDEVTAEVIDRLREAGAAVLVAPPGAGKTTRIPPALVAAGLGPVVVLEPRRIAARAAARRVAQECGYELGREVGYQVRFERRATKETETLFCTEGIVLRRLQDDPFLESVGCLVFDEFHERNLDADLALAMAQRVRREAREDLRVLVMSATLDAEPIAAFLDDAPIVRSEGKLFPVETEFVAPLARGNRSERVEDHVARAVPIALERSDGDVLVFLPGVGEIRRTADALTPGLRARGVECHELYGDLKPEQQDAALRAGRTRRVVLSTNVAESSVTVQGVRAVIDTGLARVPRQDPAIGLDRLEVERIDRAAADQRAGRAGREGPGLCLRLWSAAEDRTLSAHLLPEVKRLDLAGPLLELACWGETDTRAFPWFEAPTADALARAEDLLRSLGVVDGRGRPTKRGRAANALPLHPRLAALVLEGAEGGVLDRAAVAAALLSERDPFRRDRRAEHRDASDSDLLDRVRALEEHERSGATSFDIGELHRGAARRLLRARDQIVRSVPKPKGPRSRDDEALLRAVLAGFRDRLCRRRAEDPSRGVMASGRGIRMGRESRVTEAELFCAVDVTAGSGESLVRMASRVEREWVDGGRTRTVTEPVFDEGSGRVVGRRREVLGELVLSESDHPLQDPAETERVLLEAAQRDPARALALDRDDIAELRARVTCLAEWLPELDLPPADDAAFAELLPMLVAGRRSFRDLANAPVLATFLGSLTHRQRTALDRDAPERIAVPSGRKARLTYEPGRPPVLAIRIQELFGLTESPTVAGGRVRVLLHLLAPNGRPQQVTDDLASFWKDAYQVVRKELRSRYPKHDWPEDPLTAKPSSRPKRRR